MKLSNVNPICYLNIFKGDLSLVNILEIESEDAAESFPLSKGKTTLFWPQAPPLFGLTCNRVQWAKAAKTLMVVKLDEGMKVVCALSTF